MKITFETPKEIVVVKELKRSVSEVTIRQVVDNPSAKKVTAETLELGILVLWENEAYDTIGQWTDTDVLARVNELMA
jgi:hypothetical protein